MEKDSKDISFGGRLGRQKSVELVEELFEKYECRWQCLDPTRNDTTHGEGVPAW